VKILLLVLLLANIALAQIRVGFGYEASAKMQIIELGLQTAKINLVEDLKFQVIETIELKENKSEEFTYLNSQINLTYGIDIKIGFNYHNSLKLIHKIESIDQEHNNPMKSTFSILAQYHYAKVLLNLSNSSLHIEIPINKNLTIIPNASINKTFKIDLNINLR